MGWIEVVTPVKTGVQEFFNIAKRVDSGFRRNDGHALYPDFLRDY